MIQLFRLHWQIIQMKLSIIIPVYNEEKTIKQLLQKVFSVKFPVPNVEIIIINDGSSDKTDTIIKKIKDTNKKFVYLIHNRNQGKGAAVKTGIKKATGEYIVIQDADLEYNPQDIPRLLKPILQKQTDVVYGTRLSRLPNFFREERTIQFFIHYLGNKLLSLVTSILYLHWITDMECCYKLFPKNALRGITLHAKGFEFEPEITAKLLKKGYKIREVPIEATPRGYGEGKKLQTVRDGFRALWSLTKYRFVN